MSKIIHISFAGPVVKLKVNNRYHTFEMHRYCGPIRLKSDGETEHSDFWPEHSDFWPVFTTWFNQGKRVNRYGVGIVT